jgi:hypothetical protein
MGSPSLVPFKSMISRVAFIVVLLGIFFVLNFTGFLLQGGVLRSAETWKRFWAYDLNNTQETYILLLGAAPIVAACLVPWMVRWIRSGSR